MVEEFIIGKACFTFGDFDLAFEHSIKEFKYFIKAFKDSD
jgi:hypothetical protein